MGFIALAVITVGAWVRAAWLAATDYPDDFEDNQTFNLK